ncbi:ferulic acid esterase [Arthroderma uncinatum]|uniref:ferulic acid esterase n=1 Tax=Arthroderma uncinatum TaxID=74035 RepID=UPI00144A76FD|nr:ferulic acid esterase [Arthroderma uncinatum]KAF3481130.1 ferulic acid esterase [Arthroderma uncinatum]
MAGRSKPGKNQKNEEWYMDRKLYKRISKFKNKSQSDSTLDHFNGGTPTYYEPSAIGPGFGHSYQGYHGPARSLQTYPPSVQAQGPNSNPQWLSNPSNMAYPPQSAPHFNQAYWSPAPNTYPTYASPGHGPPVNNIPWVGSTRTQRATSWGGNNQPQHMPPRRDSRQPYPVNEHSRLRGDAPEFVPAHGPSAVAPCDQTEPTCMQCTKGGRTCTGYRNQLDLMFRDETRKTAHNASTRAQKQRGIKSTSANKASAQETPSTSLVSLCSSNTPGELSRSLPVDLNQRAICFFVYNYVIPTGPAPGRIGYMHSVTSSGTEVMSACMASVGIATLANITHSPEMRIAAREQYAHALSLTNAMLRDPVQARKPMALDTVMLLGMFEVITCRSNRSLSSWRNHHEGALALLRLRPSPSPDDMTNFRMFAQARGQILSSCLLTSSRAPPYLSGLPPEKQGSLPKSEALLEDAATLLVKLCNLRAEIEDKTLSSPDLIISQAYALEAELISFYTVLWEHYPYTLHEVLDQDTPPSPSDEIYGGCYHIYADYFIPNVYYAYRSARILLSEVIEEAFPQLSPTSPLYSQFGDLPILVEQSRIAALQAAIDICYSVPFQLGDVSKDITGGWDTRRSGRAIGGPTTPFTSMPLFTLAKVLLLLLSTSLLAASLPVEERCNAEILKLPGARAIEFIPAGTNLTFPSNDPSCNRPSQVVAVDICRVALHASTSSRSGVHFEVWLPMNWQRQRFLATGNGGIDGCIKYEDLAYGVKNGFAVVGSNNGHNGTTAISMYRNLDVQIDFAWRAGKEIVAQFYRKPHLKSYYIGCSLGGRQGFQSALKFPRDFDGIVAGAPGVDFNNLVSWRASFFPLTGRSDSPDFIPASAWKTYIHGEVLRQCDGIDGVVDGIIENPSLCHFNADALLCKEGQKTDCLTQTQVDIVRRIFTPLIDEDGKVIYSAMQPGSEELATTKLYAGKPFSYSDEWFKYAVYDPSWDASTFTAHDAAVADALNPGDVRTWPTYEDLAEFKNRNGKILVHHGCQDNQITSFNTERFYNRLIQTGPAGGAGQLDHFLRFFRISGMFHCNGGPGAWALGQGGGAASEGIEFKRENNILAAVVDWVEKGIAPDTMEGVKFVDDDVASGVVFRRRHCRFVNSLLLRTL